LTRSGAWEEGEGERTDPDPSGAEKGFDETRGTPGQFAPGHKTQAENLRQFENWRLANRGFLGAVLQRREGGVKVNRVGRPKSDFGVDGLGKVVMLKGELHFAAALD
jgi:hypothetical protein